MEKITEKDFIILEKYILSNFNENYAKELGLSKKDIQDINEEITNIQNDIQEEVGQNESFHIACVWYLANLYTLTNLSKDDKISCLSKIATIMHISSSLLTEPIFTYINRYHVNEIFSYLTPRDKQIFEENVDSLLFNRHKYVDLYYYVHTIYPHLFTHNEIEELENKLNKCVDNKTLFTDLIIQFINEARSRVENKYEDREKYEQLVLKKLHTNQIRFKKENKDEEENIYNEIKSMYDLLISCKYFVNQYKKEYEVWKRYSYREKLLTSCTVLKFGLFYFHYLFCTGRILFYLFSALNEPKALDIDQIDYILEMARKLRISSYLNEEYANYKKLYNPDARVFDFGEDEPEEEATVISKDHLERLSHFEEEKLTNLLDILKENQYIEKDTRPKDWLFAFGMSGDEKPEYFKKIQWIGRSSVGISPTYFTDFIGILGYDLKKIYFEKPKITISILNNCFKTTDKTIDQNSFKREKGEFIPTSKHKKLAKLVKECGLLTE